jgi:squalene monooxygenase
MGVFHYWHLGGACVDEPVALLGGILGAPGLLVSHFFSVAFYAIWIKLRTGPIWRLPLTFLECFGVIMKACVVIVPYIVAELRS